MDSVSTAPESGESFGLLYSVLPHGGPLIHDFGPPTLLDPVLDLVLYGAPGCAA